MKSFYLCLIFLVLATCKLAMSATTEEIHGWVDGHNFLRLKVAKGEVNGQPSAAKMNAVIWDNELYEKAQAYAQSHPNRHNSNESVPSGRFTTGENMYWFSTNDLDYKFTPYKAIESWFSEHQNYTYGPLRSSDFDSSKGYQIGHYTQLVWSDSVYIGCGISEEYDGEMKSFHVVCNYGPTGNYLGETPYPKGGPVRQLRCGCGKECNNCNRIYGGGS